MRYIKVGDEYINPRHVVKIRAYHEFVEVSTIIGLVTFKTNSEDDADLLARQYVEVLESATNG
jgi:hypothetical protein